MLVLYTLVDYRSFIKRILTNYSHLQNSKTWSTPFKITDEAELKDYKLVLIGRLSLVALVFILCFGAMNIVMGYPFINIIIDIIGFALMVFVLVAVRQQKVQLASITMTIGLMLAITVGAFTSYTEFRNNGAENLLIALIVLIVALFDGKSSVILFLITFALLIWLKQLKVDMLALSLDGNFYVELVNVAVISCGIYFSTAFFKKGLTKNLSRVRKLNSEKDELIGIVAHDLKNPLHVISGALPILKDQLKASLTEDQMKILGAIEESSQGMVSHVNQILTSNKEEHVGFNLAPKNLDLGLLLQKLIDFHQHSSELKKIAIQSNFEVGKHMLKVDENCVNRVFENLLSNAIKYTIPGKSIKLSIIELDSKTTIEFRDQGNGISPEDQTKLFNKYQSLNSRPTGNETSDGMGLFSVKKYLEAINGTIEVESELGRGTIFKVTLPNM